MELGINKDEIDFGLEHAMIRIRAALGDAQEQDAEITLAELLASLAAATLREAFQIVRDNNIRITQQLRGLGVQIPRD